MDPLDLASIADELAVVAAEWPAAAALDALTAAGHGLVVVVGPGENDDGWPLAIVTREQLRGLSERRESLTELRELLPPLVCIDVTVDGLDPQSILALADTFSLLPSTPGVLVADDGPSLRGISRYAIAAALPLDLLGDGGLRFSGATPVVPTRRFICRKCDPPSYRLPREGGQAPACPRIWFHGQMEPDGNDS